MNVDRSLPATRAVLDRQIIQISDLQGTTDPTWAGAREIGVKYAEGFVQHKGHPYPQNDLLKELSGTGL